MVMGEAWGNAIPWLSESRRREANGDLGGFQNLRV